MRRRPIDRDELEQQLAALDRSDGLTLSEAELEELAERIRTEIDRG
jgi:hypothetical protein